MEGDVSTTDTEITTVTVAVRVRPLVAKEKMEQSDECVSVMPDGKQLVLGKDRAFTFDRVFGPSSSQEDVYGSCIKGLVDGILQGYNATVFAYGQTGSGKTFTMGTGNNANVHEEDYGVAPNAIRSLFSAVEERRAQTEFLIRVSYLEIYNEEVKDLLHPSTPSKNISIREDASGGVIVMGIQEEVVTSVEELWRNLENGSLCRTTGSTLMNNASSRSHSIFTIIVEQRLHADVVSPDGAAEYVTAKFHMVDLAGSERNKKTGATGQRFKESVNINNGLLALGNVISVLGDERKRGGHVPYRDSKLTRLLKDSLGGNAKTVMIACVSPADINFEETLNTLRYANRAKNIRNKPIVNRDPQSLQLAQLRSEVQALQLELLKHKGVEGVPNELPPGVNFEEFVRDVQSRHQIEGIQSMTIFSADAQHELELLRERNHNLEREVLGLKEKLTVAEEESTSLSEESIELKRERDHLIQAMNQSTALIGTMLSSQGIPDRIVNDLKTLQSLLAKSPQPSSQSAPQTPAKSPKPVRDSAHAAKHAAVMARIEQEYENVRGAADALSRPRTAPMRRKTAPSPADAKKLQKSVAFGGCFDSPNHRLSRPGKVAESPDKKCSSPSTIPGTSESIATEISIDVESHLNNVKELERDVSLLREELATAKESLQEAQDDLARDEEIFAEKLSEIKRLYKQNKQLEREKSEAQGEAANLSKQLEDLQLGRGVPLQQENSQVSVGDGVVSAEVAVTMEADIAALEEDKARIQAEKDDLEREKESIAVEAEHQRKQYEVKKRQMEQQLNDLNENIRMKEQLIEDLVRNERDADQLRQEYETRLAELEEEVTLREVEMDNMKKELDGVEETFKMKTEEEKRKIREEYEARLHTAGTQLLSLRRKQKDQAVLIKMRERDANRAVELESEVERMKAESENLKKKLKEDTSKLDSKKEHKVRELLKQKKDHERRIKELEEENARHIKVLKRKMEEAATLRRKQQLKGAQTPRTPQKAGIPARPTPVKKLTGDIEEKKKRLDKEIDELVKRQEAATLLKKKVKTRDAKMIQKEEALAKRSTLELRKMRKSQNMASTLKGLNQKIDSLDEETYDNGGKRSIHDLEALRKDMYEKRAQMEEKARSHQFLTAEEEEELLEMDEKIETLEAEIDYQTSAIAEVERNLKAGNNSEKLFNQVETIPYSECKEMLKAYIQTVVDTKSTQKHTQSQVYELQVCIQEKQQQIEELEHSFKLNEMEFDRRITKERKEHELKVQYLLRQINSGEHRALSGSEKEKEISADKMLKFKDEQISMLDKDNFFYKQSNRDLKRKMRELMLACENDRSLVDKERDERKKIAQVNQSLMTELQNLKAYLRRQHEGGVAGAAAVPVRVSLKDLKQVDEEKVARAMASVSASPSQVKSGAVREQSQQADDLDYDPYDPYANRPVTSAGHGPSRPAVDRPPMAKSYAHMPPSSGGISRPPVESNTWANQTGKTAATNPSHVGSTRPSSQGGESRDQMTVEDFDESENPLENSFLESDSD